MTSDDIKIAHEALTHYNTILVALDDAKTWGTTMPLGSKNGFTLHIDTDLVITMLDCAAARAKAKLQALGIEV
jgi:hypothetical protein